MVRTLFVFLVCLLVCAAAATAGQRQPTTRQPNPPQPAGPPKQARAVRVQPGAMHLDGRLDESIWEQIEPVVDFQQAEPNDHAAPTDAMEVRFVYDDNA